jgi:transcriptional regulator with GAF, ATPase, and Fis domain
MRDRVLRPITNGYQRYGGAGITICERWDSFENFLADMGERPVGMTLDRKNSKGNYEPDNCKWSTWIEQESNRKDNVFVILNGERIHAAEAARRLGVKDYALRRLAKKLGGYQIAVDHLASVAG